MAFVLSDMKQFLADQDYDNRSNRGTRNFVKIANAASSELRSLGKWDFDKRVATLIYQPMLSPASGTCSATISSGTVTGVGTTFTSAMVGRYIRFNSETLSYRITAFSSATSITIETYQGDANITGATYTITDVRVALPARFRCLEKPNIKLGWRLLDPVQDLRDLKVWRRLLRETGIPRNYGIEWAPPDTGSSTIPSPYMWIYPDPTEKEVLDLMFFQWGQELVNDSDDFGIPNDNTAAYDILRELAKGHLWLDAKDQRGPAQIVYARALGIERLQEYRGIEDAGQREEFREDSGGRQTFRRRLATPGT